MVCSLKPPLDVSFPFMGLPIMPGSEIYICCVRFSDITFKNIHNLMQVSDWQILVFKLGQNWKTDILKHGLYIQHWTSSILLLITFSSFWICQSGGGWVALLPVGSWFQQTSQLAGGLALLKAGADFYNNTSTCLKSAFVKRDPKNPETKLRSPLTVCFHRLDFFLIQFLSM